MSMTYNSGLENKIALITGGGTGIGFAAAEALAAGGVTVALMGRRETNLENAAASIVGNGGKALSVRGDITKENSVKRSIGTIIEKFGKIDILINDAGLPGWAANMHEVTDEMWQEMMDYNLTGTFRMIRAVLPYFIERKQGVIVNVSSIAGLVGMPRNSAYSVAKSGIIALTRCVAVEYGHLGIRCNCVCPGLTETPMTEDYLKLPDTYRQNIMAYPTKRLGSPQDIAEAIVFLSSNNPFLTGAVLTVDGGYTAW